MIEEYALLPNMAHNFGQINFEDKIFLLMYRQICHWVHFNSKGFIEISTYYIRLISYI